MGQEGCGRRPSAPGAWTQWYGRLLHLESHQAQQCRTSCQCRPAATARQRSCKGTAGRFHNIRCEFIPTICICLLPLFNHTTMPTPAGFVHDTKPQLNSSTCRHKSLTTHKHALAQAGSPALLSYCFTACSHADSIRSLYQAAEDAATITPKDTEAFLERLQAQLSTVGYDMDLTLFVDLANQVVLLLQQARADALLSLLRQYAQTGSLALESNDQDQLLREVNSVLQPSAWDTWFRFTSTRDSSSVPIRRVSRRLRVLTRLVQSCLCAPVVAP